MPLLLNINSRHFWSLPGGLKIKSQMKFDLAREFCKFGGTPVERELLGKLWVLFAAIAAKSVCGDSCKICLRR